MLGIHPFALFLTTGILLNLTPGPDTLTSRDEDRSDATFMDYLWGYAPFVLFVVGCAAGAISLFSGHR